MLRQRYEQAPNGESRTRYQMLLLAQQGYKVSQIARIVLRSEDTVARVFHRFLTGGLDAVPRRTMARFPRVARYMAQTGVMSARATIKPQATQAAVKSWVKVGASPAGRPRS
jgi:hypothetical protein